jgi:hypothetical protein
MVNDDEIEPTVPDDPFVIFHLQFAVMIREWTEMVLDKTQASDAVRRELLDKCQFYERKIHDIVNHKNEVPGPTVPHPNPQRGESSSTEMMRPARDGGHTTPTRHKRKPTLDSIIDDLLSS